MINSVHETRKRAMWINLKRTDGYPHEASDGLAYPSAQRRAKAMSTRALLLQASSTWSRRTLLKKLLRKVRRRCGAASLYGTASFHTEGSQDPPRTLLSRTSQLSTRTSAPFRFLSLAEPSTATGHHFKVGLPHFAREPSVVASRSSDALCLIQPCLLSSCVFLSSACLENVKNATKETHLEKNM